MGTRGITRAIKHHDENVNSMLANQFFDPNHPITPNRTTVLHLAIESNNLSAMRVLLRRLDIQYNLEDIHGDTVYIAACANESSTAPLKLLFEEGTYEQRDQGIDTDARNHAGKTGLDYIYMHETVEHVKWLIVYDAIHVSPSEIRSYARYARRVKGSACMEIHQLVVDCMEDPWNTRQNVMAELGLGAPGLFATVIFLCDGLLRISSKAVNWTDGDGETVRFFVMIQKFPMELQLMICQRVYDGEGDTIKQRHIEASFRALAKTYINNNNKKTR
jgi:hypothetical protein